MKVKLYLKRHKVTGLYYFGKTTGNNIEKYKGSGVYWKRHLKVHGNDIETVWHDEFNSVDDAKDFALLFSDLHDIVNSSKFANEIPEDGKSGWPSGVKRGPNEKARTIALERLENGTHPFSGGHLGRQISQSRIADGTHHFLDSEVQRQIALNSIKNGTHPFVGENAPTKQRWTCEHCGVSGQGKGNFTRWHKDGKCSE